MVDHAALAAEVSRWRESVAGWVSVPGDEGYAAARRTSNGVVVRLRVMAVSCRTVDDVRWAVDSAARLGISVSVRGGGHSVAGHGVGDDSVLVDLSPMRSVLATPDRTRARVGGGATWNDVDAVPQRQGLAVPGGTFGDTGVGGLTLAGGSAG